MPNFSHGTFLLLLAALIIGGLPTSRGLQPRRPGPCASATELATPTCLNCRAWCERCSGAEGPSRGLPNSEVNSHNTHKELDRDSPLLDKRNRSNNPQLANRLKRLTLRAPPESRRTPPKSRSLKTSPSASQSAGRFDPRRRIEHQTKATSLLPASATNNL